MGGEYAADKPVLLFLHGVGTGDPKGAWKAALSKSLARVGYPGLESASVIAPRYAGALKFDEEDLPLPPLTTKQPTGDAAKQNRRDFERRMAAIEFRLGTHDPGPGMVGADALMDVALGIPFFVQARHYLQEPNIRAHVLTRILRKLPESGRIVIVGHSLGSVIAADLVRRLPASIEVAGMVTIGSPLASDVFGVDKLRETLSEPPGHLGWWVSFWDGNDLVAARRGVSSAFPWMMDLRVHTKSLGPMAAHEAVEYLSHDVVAEAVGFALYGSLSKELAVAERGVDVPIDTAENFALLGLRYAHLIASRLKGDQRDRYVGALRHVQATLAGVLMAQRKRTGRPVPAVVARLALDLSDPRAAAPEPQPARHLSKHDAVVPLTVLLAENVIAPYEIEVNPEVKREAMKDLTAEMGLSGTFGVDVFSAAASAQSALGGGSSFNWLKWGALGAGAVAIVLATGGLALAAGAGLAGAAAITSALAAFGPGGMIGGLLTAGTLVTAGGGGIALGLASPATSADAVEAVLAGQLTVEIVRKRHGLSSDPAVWRNLIEMEMELRREHERLDEFSDRAAASIKELKRKLVAVERALAFLDAAGLAPRSDARDAEDIAPTREGKASGNFVEGLVDRARRMRVGGEK
ncbi:hypothetical protein [Microbacterium sp. NPDC056736]|uniref:hypothetical protein n=1 Tax=Microbacterium sp. NPDC056736 TaxID=3345932 RepID=UPI00366FD300